MPKQNDTFDHIDEWVLQYGQKISKEKAETFCKMQWKIAKADILKIKKKMLDIDPKSILYKLAKKDYNGILWKYEEVIKKYKIQK